MKSSKSLILRWVLVTLQTLFFPATEEQSIFLENWNPWIKLSTTWTGSHEAEAAAGAGRSCPAAWLRAAACPWEALEALHPARELGQGWDNLPPSLHPPWRQAGVIGSNGPGRLRASGTGLLLPLVLPGLNLACRVFTPGVPLRVPGHYIPLFSPQFNLLIWRAAVLSPPLCLKAAESGSSYVTTTFDKLRKKTRERVVPEGMRWGFSLSLCFCTRLLSVEHGSGTNSHLHKVWTKPWQFQGMLPPPRLSNPELIYTAGC